MGISRGWHPPKNSLHTLILKSPFWKRQAQYVMTFGMGDSWGHPPTFSPYIAIEAYIWLEFAAKQGQGQHLQSRGAWWNIDLVGKCICFFARDRFEHRCHRFSEEIPFRCNQILSQLWPVPGIVACLEKWFSAVHPDYESVMASFSGSRHDICQIFLNLLDLW